MLWKRWKTHVKEHNEVIAAELAASAADGERLILEPTVGLVHDGAVVQRSTLALTNRRVIVWGSDVRKDVSLNTVVDVRESASFQSGRQGGNLFVILRTHAADVALSFPEDVAPTWTAAIQTALAERPTPR